MNMGSMFHAVVPVTIGSEKIEVLFDTGKSGFMALWAKDFERLSAREGNVEKLDAGYGLLYIGLSGIEGAIRDSVHRVNIPSITIPGGFELKNVGTLVGHHPATIFGQELFDYGVVVLDYPRGMFYFLPYEEGPADVVERTRSWNARILPIVEEDHSVTFRVVMTIGDVDLQIGDRVWSIGGTDISEEEPNEGVVQNLLRGVDTVILMVGGSKDSLREVIMRMI
jgi:hypothetical protein